jgi:hypothetical protein
MAKAQKAKAKAKGKAKAGPQPKKAPVVGRPRPTAANPNPVKQHGLTQPGTAYFRQLTNPFHNEAPVGIPDQYAVSSQKLMVVSRGMFSVGTNGVGYIAVRPEIGIANNDWNSGANDFRFVTHTNNLFTGTEVGHPLPGVGVVSAYSNSPYTAAMLNTPSRKMRVVSCGIKVQYTGTELNMAGSYYASRNPNNDATPFETLDEMRAYRLSSQHNVTREPCVVTYTPMDPDDYQYKTYDEISRNGDYYAPLARTCPVISPMIWVYGAVPGVSFIFEVAAQYELIGSNIPLTPTRSAPQDVGRIVSAVNANAPARTVERTVQQAASFLQDVGSIVGTGLMIGKLVAGLA